MFSSDHSQYFPVDILVCPSIHYQSRFGKIDLVWALVRFSPLSQVQNDSNSNPMHSHTTDKNIYPLNLKSILLMEFIQKLSSIVIGPSLRNHDNHYSVCTVVRKIEIEVCMYIFIFKSIHYWCVLPYVDMLQSTGVHTLLTSFDMISLNIGSDRFYLIQQHLQRICSLTRYV